jgi:transketolase N-terminal domain/subunit
MEFIWSDVIEFNGNEIKEIIDVLDDADEIREKPVAIIAHTI